MSGDELDCGEAPISFARSFVVSSAFRTLFQEGMQLVEETAAYLDGDGRADSAALGHAEALAYATESMRLTTRLMQIASWLLLQRAVAEGEMTEAEAEREAAKSTVERGTVDRNTGERGAAARGARGAPAEATPAHLVDAQPARLRDLMGRALRLEARVAHLDRLLKEKAARPQAAPSPLALHLDRLEAAFNRTA